MFNPLNLCVDFFCKKNDILNPKYFKFEDKDEILTSMCIIRKIYLSIGKLDGNLIIYALNNNYKIYSNKFFNKSITCLMTYEENNSSFFACSEEPIIKHLKIIPVKEKQEYIIQTIGYVKIHDSCTKIMKYLGNDIFASCSLDSSFAIWKLNKNNKNNEYNEILKLKDQNWGLENFFLKMKNNSFNSLITLNTKGGLSFYIKDKNNKPLLRNVIFDVDFTNSKSMIEIGDKLYIGGYNFLQIFSVKNMQLETKIKTEIPISYIYEQEHNTKFLILGLKNGNLKFIEKKKLQLLKENDIKKLEEDSKDFRLSYLFKRGEAQVFKNESIISCLIFDGKFICISDESIMVLNKDIIPNNPKKKKNFHSFF